MHYNIFIKFLISLAMGFLIGLEREFSFETQNKRVIAGIRTFSLIALVGCSAGMLAEQFDSIWALVIVLAIGGTFLCINLLVHQGRDKYGLTTEFAALMTMIIGVLIYMEHIAVGVAIGVTVMTLLSLKLEMHAFVRHLEKSDIAATIKFAVISAIILPFLPNKFFGPEPFHIFNPYKIWLLVVFISGISFVGYILTKIIGAKRGIGLLGFLGGLASSTAVTLTLTQRSKENSSYATSFTFAIIVAWTVMYIRLFAIVAAVNSTLIQFLWLPFICAVAAGLLYCLYLAKKRDSQQKDGDMALTNPFELGPAIKFGLLFSLILLVAKGAQVYLGNTGIYLAGVISGLADVDAIALSVAGLALDPNQLLPKIAAETIIIATASNTFLKGMIVIIGGSKTMHKEIIPGIVLLMGIPLIFLLFI